jgi:hypothetical protein
MAITLNTYPANISNAAAFNVTTSLVEDASHVNLRIRADVYHEGIIKAVVEKPKGLADFDFSDILKSLTPGLLFPRDSGNIYKCGTIGLNLLTDFTHDAGWDAFTHTGFSIEQAFEPSTDAVWATSNNIAMIPGELYLLYSPNFASYGGNTPYLALYTTITHAAIENIFANKGILIMPTVAGNFYFKVGGSGGLMNFSGAFYLHKITTNRIAIGNPLAPYFVIFTEYYETAAGVTTAGATSATKVYRYVPAIGDGTAFTEYVMHDSACLFANKTLRNNITKWFLSNCFEYWVSLFTEYVECNYDYDKDGSGWIENTLFIYEGWGVFILNVGELFNGVTNYLKLRVHDAYTPFTVYSETITIYRDTSQIDERVVLEFDGLVGGKEYLAFEGIKNISFNTIRNYYQGSKKNKKLLSAFGKNRQKIETRFKDMANAEYLKSLLISEDVKKLEASYATPTAVTILTEDVKISDSDMFTNQLDIEYEY